MYVGDKYSKTPTDYEFSFENHHSSTVAIDQGLLLKLCQDDEDDKRMLTDNGNYSTYCEVYVMALSKSQSV